jgi:predicted amidohydrolase YtcJ
MRVPQRLQAVVLTGVVIALLLGCGGVRNAAARAQRSNRLKAAGLAYINYCDDNRGKGPTGAQDLQKYLTEFPDVSQALQNGDIVIYWNVRFPDDMQQQGTSNTVLGYEKDVPAKGGMVIMGDGSVREMTAQEFQTAPKATPGKK